MSTHILVIEPDPTAPAMGPHHTDDRTWSIECPPGNGCSGWMECGEKHEVEGHGSAEDGPDDCEETAPWEGCDEFEFHGVMHEWKGGHGWTVPWPGCVVAGSDWSEPPAEMDDLPTGRYPIEDDWDDTSVALDFVDPLPGRCAESTPVALGRFRHYCKHHAGHAGPHQTGNVAWEDAA